jgi:hypothetical protein
MMIKEVVEKIGDIYSLPCLAKDMAKFWEDKLKLVPLEYQVVAEWDIELSVWYDSPSFEATLSYYREETEEERNYREQASLREAERIRAYEVSEFNRLKAKLGE